MLMLIAVLCLAAFLVPDASTGASVGPRARLVGWGGLPGLTCDWYFKHHQWRADLRTTLAAARFVLSADRKIR
jgi:hypothetical protein